MAIFLKNKMHKNIKCFAFQFYTREGFKLINSHKKTLKEKTIIEAI